MCKYSIDFLVGFKFNSEVGPVLECKDNCGKEVYPIEHNYCSICGKQLDKSEFLEKDGKYYVVEDCLATLTEGTFDENGIGTLFSELDNHVKRGYDVIIKIREKKEFK